jgi:hypothetical protein
MSFIDQLMAARGLPISLFGGNSRGTTPPINPSPNVNTIRDGGYGANLLPTGGVRPQVNMGLMGQVRQPPPQPWETYDVNKPGDILPQSYWEAVKQTVSEIGKTGLSFRDKLIQSESSGRSTIVNSRGYMGKYQFGEARLKDYMDATGSNFSKQSFLNSSVLQDRVYDWHTQDNKNYITKHKLNSYVGKKIRGIEVTLDGMLAVAHLGGKTGLRKFLQSNGKYNPDDDGKPGKKGTTLLDYLKKFK